MLWRFPIGFHWTGALVLFTVSQPNIDTAHRFISLVMPQLP